MIYNTREEYREARKKLARLSTPALERLLGELSQKRYDEQDVSYESDHRMASSVYIQRKMDAKQLMFHMKKFIL